MTDRVISVEDKMQAKVSIGCPEMKQCIHALSLYNDDVNQYQGYTIMSL